jgi:hypothetical protein
MWIMSGDYGRISGLSFTRSSNQITREEFLGLRSEMNNPENNARATDNQATGKSPMSAVPLGKIIKTTVERGHAYMVPRLYNVEVTLKDVIRGLDAESRAKTLVKPGWKLNDGYEYLLALIKFGYFERGRVAAASPGGQYVPFGGGSVDVTYTLPEGQLLAVSTSGETEYEIPSVSQQPEPSLIGWEFHPGETREGWVLFQVPREEKTPLLIFKREHVEGIYGIWGYIWLQLYHPG